MVTGTVAFFWKFIDLSSLEFHTLSSPEFPGPDFQNEDLLSHTVRVESCRLSLGN